MFFYVFDGMNMGNMSEDEIVVIFFSCIFLFKFCKSWYQPIFNAWPTKRNLFAKLILGFLPLAFLAALYLMLKNFASYDVVDSISYIGFYILLGFAWMYGCLTLMTVCFGIIWTDDAIYHKNKAALVVIIGEFFALAAIYAGANIGDGPGWWCVLFAGILGLAAWFILGFIYHLFTGIFERISVERDFGSGLRFCLYLVLSGIILGNACSGDWTSFSKTIEEFEIAWPVLPLTVIMILAERLINLGSKQRLI